MCIVLQFKTGWRYFLVTILVHSANKPQPHVGLPSLYQSPPCLLLLTVLMPGRWTPRLLGLKCILQTLLPPVPLLHNAPNCLCTLQIAIPVIREKWPGACMLVVRSLSPALFFLFFFSHPFPTPSLSCKFPQIVSVTSLSPPAQWQGHEPLRVNLIYGQFIPKQEAFTGFAIK